MADHVGEERDRDEPERISSRRQFRLIDKVTGSVMPFVLRAIFILACFAYAAACVGFAVVDGTSATISWVLVVAAISHVIFGIEAIYRCFARSWETELQAERAKNAMLQELVTKLSIDVADLQKDRATK